LSDLLERIQRLVEVGESRISEHGYDELSEDGIFARDAIRGVSKAVAVEEYPPSGRGPAVLEVLNMIERRNLFTWSGVYRLATSLRRR